MIDNNLYIEIEQYCKLNDIEDIDKFINNLLRKSFNSEKYKINKNNKVDNNIIINKTEENKSVIIDDNNVDKQLEKKEEIIIIKKEEQQLNNINKDNSRLEEKRFYNESN